MAGRASLNPGSGNSITPDELEMPTLSDSNRKSTVAVQVEFQQISRSSARCTHSLTSTIVAEPIPRDSISSFIFGNQLPRKLNERHMLMIAVGGTIGNGLLVGTGESLASGGPAGILVAFVIVSAMLFNVMEALTELTVLFPTEGSFVGHGTRFLDPALGFAMGWAYSLSWLIILPLELSAASRLAQFWGASVPMTAAIIFFLMFIVAVHMLGSVRAYGEVESVFSSFKITAVMTFIIYALLVVCGAAPEGGALGVAGWRHSSAFRNGFHGFCGVFANAAFAFSGIELVGLAAAEAIEPRRTVPKAINRVFWIIVSMYTVSIMFIGLVVPSDNPLLLDRDSPTERSAFMIAIRTGGVKVLPDIFNGVILIAVLSVGNAAAFAASRTLMALARADQAPKILGSVDKNGRPLAALILSLTFGMLAFIANASYGPDIFHWLAALSSMACFFVWGSICLCHVRFRKAWQMQGHTLDELPYRAVGGVIGSWIGVFSNILCLAATCYANVWPIDRHGQINTVQGFFLSYLGLPVFFGLYLCYKIHHRNRYPAGFLHPTEIDVTSNRQELQARSSVTETERRPFRWSRSWQSLGSQVRLPTRS